MGFRIIGPARDDSHAGKLPATRDTSKTSADLFEMARREGKRVDQVMRENPVPDGERPIPWPLSGPVNDADKPPMRLK